MARRSGITPPTTAPDHEAMKAARSRTLASGLEYDAEKYTYSDRFTPAKDLSVQSVHSTSELVALMESDKTVDIDARILGVDRHNSECRVSRVQGREKFLECFKQGNRRRSMREATDTFSSGEFNMSAGKLGDVFVPLLGGPFNKQLYFYDYLRMHALSFNFYHHNPFARHQIRMTSDFTLGRGYRVDCKDDKAMALWRTFEAANKLPELMESVSQEMGIYGEVMLWWLPNYQSRIVYNPRAGEVIPTGLIPRIRLIDPSVIWEVVTYPEDITRVLFYQWIAPTQFQYYTGTDSDGTRVPGSKFIFQQIPGGDVQHYKINSVSNEKRGRSDLFPNLGFMKRLIDAVDLSMAADQKNAAWAIDTTIEGGARDLDAYVSDQQAQGTVAPAGSEFVHTDKVKRLYNSNSSGAGSKASPSFEWTLSCIAAGSGYPMSYWNTHLSGSQARASAIVSTEPVAKMLERRQLVYERVLLNLWTRYFKTIGYTPKSDPEVSFPEIITADRSVKMKDIALAEEMNWIKPERAATMGAKELGITNYEYDEEQQEMPAPGVAALPQVIGAPLTAPGAAGKSPSALPSNERTAVKNNDRNA